MIVRIGYWIGLAAVAIVVAFAQLDQQSRIAPEYAVIVPDAFSGNAARQRARLALQYGAGETLLDDARLQVRLRPVPAESLTIYALAAMTAGEQGQSLEALSAASTRGWREPISQLASGEAALGQGQYAVAAQRVTALLSTGLMNESAYQLLSRLISVREGQQAFAHQLAQFGRWQDNALGQAGAYVDPVDWAETIALAQQGGADLSCHRLADLAARYDRRSQSDVASLFWPGNCPTSE